MGLLYPCSVCGEASKLRCSGCKIPYYCSKDHQKSDWKAGHKKLCRPFSVEQSVELGRHIVASVDLPSGTVFLREEPLVVGPKQWTRPLCLGCFRYVGKKSPKCQKCGWPMCSETCARKPQHQPECMYTCRRKLSHKSSEESDDWKVSIKQFDQFHPMYQSVTLLRCLYLRDHNIAAWEKLMSLESHCAIRKKRREKEGPRAGDDDWIGKFTKNFYGLEAAEEECLKKIIGILLVNGHEVPVSQQLVQGGEVPSYVALYHMASMVEHSCIPNCRKHFVSGDEIELRTTQFVGNNKKLAINYADPLWGTVDRYNYLNSSKYFTCNCERCKDPTELGTFLSGVKCLNCREGYYVPVKRESGEDEENPENFVWECWGKANKNAKKTSGCGSVMSFDEANRIVKVLGCKLSEIEEGNLNETQEYIRVNSEKILHKNHHYLVSARLGLMRLLQARCSGETARNANKESPEMKLLQCTCLELLEIANVLCPGMTEIRGMLLYELSAHKLASIVQNTANCIKPKIIERDLIDRLEEAVYILSIDPTDSVSGAMASRGLATLKRIQQLQECTPPKQ